MIKIKNISLNNYNQFQENLQLNFTYPKGHKKEGKSLDKICIIGQSSTGKTSLLNLIKNLVSKEFSNTPKTIEDKKVTINYEKSGKFAKHTLINFPAYSVENIKKLNYEDIIDYKAVSLSNIIDFENSDPKQHWYPIQKEITEYQRKAINKRAEFSKKIEKIDINKFKDEYHNFMADFDKWKKENKNPLTELQEFLKPILEKFYLKIKTEPDNINEIKFIPIENLKEDKQGNRQEIQTKFLSTGTQQILARAVPLFALKPKNTIILIDEPENSLYPDIQKKFIDFITQETWNNKKDNCQFIFATHSPTIASSFDPWEIIELKFDKQGKVYQEKYYEGERHIDNYKFYPKYLRWDSIYFRIFDIEEDGDELRIKELNKFAKLNVIIKKMEKKQKTNSKEYKNLINERNKLGKKLDWRY